MLNHEQLRKLIILPALSKLQQYSDDAVELLMFTCAVESNGGTYVKQEKGPALGIYQMEPKTYNDLWANYIRHRSDISLILGTQFNAYRMPDENRLIYDLEFSTIMARLFYLRISDSLPNAKDENAIYTYYKKYWNTEKGASTQQKSIKAYRNFIGKTTANKEQIEV